jgi:two-component system, NtrC family, nitrogen regulation sensor histidine kinase GlnL
VPPPDAADLVAALPVAVLLVDPEGRVTYANAAAEELLNQSARLMTGQALASLLPLPDSSSREGPMAVYDLAVTTSRGQELRVDYLDDDLPAFPGWRAVTLHAVAPRRLGHPVGARAAVGAAAMLAHEIKNPLSGIRGAAQLIGGGELPRLIVSEVDRIAALIDRMAEFSDTRPLATTSTNIYPVIEHSLTLARAGFASDVPIEERFDPSLPPAAINRDALTQILLNLLKNGCEAARGGSDPRLVVTTAYRPGLAASVAADRPRQPLPIEICVLDNGPGPPPEIAEHIFEPFVSGRPEGQGLGLPLVNKLVRDMGGLVQFAREGTPPWTVLRILLPRAGA